MKAYNYFNGNHKKSPSSRFREEGLFLYLKIDKFEHMKKTIFIEKETNLITFN
jgi:hypothetical protein